MLSLGHGVGAAPKKSLQSFGHLSKINSTRSAFQQAALIRFRRLLREEEKQIDRQTDR